MKSRSKPVSKVYSKLPSGYHLVDPARSRKQATSLRHSYPKDANAIIVKTHSGSHGNRGKDKVTFPYHIASNNRLY